MLLPILQAKDEHGRMQLPFEKTVGNPSTNVNQLSRVWNNACARFVRSCFEKTPVAPEGLWIGDLPPVIDFFRLHALGIELKDIEVQGTKGAQAAASVYINIGKEQGAFVCIKPSLSSAYITLEGFPTALA